MLRFVTQCYAMLRKQPNKNLEYTSISGKYPFHLPYHKQPSNSNNPAYQYKTMAITTATGANSRDNGKQAITPHERQAQG